MSQQKPAVSIVGLGVIGASAGLCLRKAGAASQVIGHDKSAEASSQAKKTGAVDRTEWNLISACEKADIVLLALPFAAVRETLQAISPHLRPGSVVLDVSTAKAPVLEWADELLPPEAHFVGLDPVLANPTPALGESGTGKEGAPPQMGAMQPRADLFQGGLICVVPSGRAAPDAVQLAADLVAILGAKPLFLDALEHDGLIALTGNLPPVLALALLQTGLNGTSWREARKLAGPAFEGGTAALPAELSAGEEWLANRDNLVRWIDAFAESLGVLRALLSEGDAGTLAELLEETKKERAEWLRRRSAGDWEEVVRQELPKPSLMRPFFGGLWPRRPKPAEKPRGGG
jgi:prephenate dehydrogenase